MSFDKHIRRGHPALFSLLILLAIIEGSLATWITARFLQHHNYPNLGVRDRTRFLLFTSWFTVLGSALLVLLFMHSASTGSILTSVASHGIFLLLIWVFWTAGAVSITLALNGGINCSTVQREVTYCNQLNGLIGFAWAAWIITTILLIAVIIRGISSLRRGDGARGQLVTV